MLMLIIKNGKILVDKGDTGEITVSVMEADGIQRPLQANDRFVLAISVKPSGPALMEVEKVIGADEAGNTEAVLTITADKWAEWESADGGRYTGKIFFFPKGSETERYTIFPPLEADRCQVEDINWQNVFIRP